jgi:hypothetical protein
MFSILKYRTSVILSIRLRPHPRALPPVRTQLMWLHYHQLALLLLNLQAVYEISNLFTEKGPNTAISAINYFLQASLDPRRACYIHCLWNAVWRGFFNCGFATYSKVYHRVLKIVEKNVTSTHSFVQRLWWSLTSSSAPIFGLLGQ